MIEDAASGLWAVGKRGDFTDQNDYALYVSRENAEKAIKAIERLGKNTYSWASAFYTLLENGVRTTYAPNQKILDDCLAYAAKLEAKPEMSEYERGCVEYYKTMTVRERVLRVVEISPTRYE